MARRDHAPAQLYCRCLDICGVLTVLSQAGAEGLLLYHFYPALFFIARQSLLFGLRKRQVGEEVTHQRSHGSETAQIILATLDQELQTKHWVRAGRQS